MKLGVSGFGLAENCSCSDCQMHDELDARESERRVRTYDVDDPTTLDLGDVTEPDLTKFLD